MRHWAIFILLLMASLLMLIVGALYSPRATASSVREVIFISNRNNPAELYRMQFNGARVEKITDRDSRRPSLSPDEEWLGYSHAGDLCLVRPDGSTKQCLDNLTLNVSDVYWKPDNHGFIVEYALFNSPPRLMMVSRTGQIQGEIGPTRAQEFSFGRFSPDGEWVVYSARRVVNWDIYVARVDSSEVQRLTTDILIEVQPRWSPDGQWIMFYANHTGNWDVYRMRPDGSDMQNLTNHPAQDYSFEWLPDSEHILFYSTRNNISGLYRMRADGSEVELIIEQFGRSTDRLSPDGEWLLFHQRVGQSPRNNEIFRMRVDGTDLTQLTNHPDQDEQAIWGRTVNVTWHPTRLWGASIGLLTIAVVVKRWTHTRNNGINLAD